MSGEQDAAVSGRSDRARRERTAVLEGMLRPGEAIVARDVVLLTDRRVLFAWRALSGWRADGVAFDEIRGWALGRRHDGRPLVRLEHPTHLRIERVPAHRLFRLSWGDAEGEVPHEDVTLSFGSAGASSFRALVQRLEELRAPRRDDFVMTPPGTRADRTRTSRAVLRRV